MEKKAPKESKPKAEPKDEEPEEDEAAARQPKFKDPYVDLPKR